MDAQEIDLRKELHALVGNDASLFRFLQEGAQHGIWYWNPERPSEAWLSARFWALLGYTAEEKVRLASRWQVLIDESDWQAMVQQVIRHGDDPANPFEKVFPCRHKDGSTVWMRCRALAIPHTGKESRRILGTLTHLTPQKLTQQQLKSSQTLLAAVFDSIQDGICVLNRELNIVTVNRAMKTWFAHALPLEGKKCFAAYHERRIACETCPTARAMQSGKLEMNEIPLIKRGTEVGTLEVFAFPMLNETGQTETVVEYMRDITVRKQAESLLKDREQLFRSLFEDNHCAMLLVDPETGAVVDANPAACVFYGFPEEVLTDMQITQINTLSREELFKEMRKAKAEERNYFDFRHRLADGTIRDVEVFSGPITIGDRALLCSIIHDVSARKEVEREKERLIDKLQKALSEVKTLRGFLPICASCKKIRDDKGYWNQIESYIRNHSEAEFSHGICPDCARRLYPGLGIKTEP
jgi:PAS domain S-box-containing protein